MNSSLYFKVESNINMKKRTKKIPMNIFNHLFYNSYLFLLYQIFQIFDNLYLFRKKKIVKRKYTIKIGFWKTFRIEKMNISYWPSYFKVININIIISLMLTIIDISHFIILWKVFVIKLIISLTFPSTWKLIILKKLYFMCNIFQILSARNIQQANGLAF